MFSILTSAWIIELVYNILKSMKLFRRETVKKYDDWKIQINLLPPSNTQPHVVMTFWKYISNILGNIVYKGWRFKLVCLIKVCKFLNQLLLWVHLCPFFFCFAQNYVSTLYVSCIQYYFLFYSHINHISQYYHENVDVICSRHSFYFTWLKLNTFQSGKLVINDFFQCFPLSLLPREWQHLIWDVANAPMTLLE